MKMQGHKWESRRRSRSLPLLLVVLLSCSTLLAGCWDTKDIEQQGFVMGVGIDIPENPGPNRSLALTLQMAVPSNWYGAGETKVGAAEKSYWNITTEGDALSQMVQSLSLRTNRKPLFSHVQMVLIGEEAARQEQLDNLLNSFLRSAEVKRRVYVAVVEGTAKEALDVQPMLEPVPAMSLGSMTLSEKNALAMPPSVTLGGIDEHLLNEATFGLQRVVPGEEDVKMAGMAIFDGKKQRMVGWLEERLVVGYSFLVGEVRRGILTVPYGDGKVVVELEKVDVNVDPHVEGREISFHVTAKVKGQLMENWTDHAPSDQSFMEGVEAAVVREIRQAMQQTVDSFQHHWGLDGLEFWRKLQHFEPDTWDWARENWNERFRDVAVSYDVQVEMMDYGMLYRH